MRRFKNFLTLIEASLNKKTLQALVGKGENSGKPRIEIFANKIKNGELDDKHQINMNDQIEEYIAQNQKINAIKYYRQEMDENYSIRMTLREAKEYIDNTAEDMRRRGIIK